MPILNEIIKDPGGGVGLIMLETYFKPGTIQVNTRQCKVIIKKLQAALKMLRGNTIALLKLSFKPGTD